MKMTYGSLVGSKTTDGSIRNWLGVANLPVEAILLDAQAMIYSQMRVREMIQRATIVLPLGNAFTALPDGYLDPVALAEQDGLGYVELVDLAELERARTYDENGTLETSSVTCANATSTLEFDAKTDQARRFSLIYYGRPADLGGSNQENFLTKRYPHILRTMTAALAADYRHDDENYTRWLTRSSALIGSAQIEGDLSKRGTIYPRGFTRG